MTVFEKFLPMKTEGGPNKRLHWRRRAQIAKRERECAWLVLIDWRFQPRLPCTITLTRMTPTKFLDPDNLAGVLKHIQDGVADRLKIDDGNPGITWKYDQLRCKRGDFGVFVRFESL